MADPIKDMVNPEAVEGVANLPTGAASPTLASGNEKPPEPVAKTKKAGKRYRVLHTQVGEFNRDDEATFGPEIDVQRLLDLGAIEEVK